jgi:hypothetical protein
MNNRRKNQHHYHQYQHQELPINLRVHDKRDDSFFNKHTFSLYPKTDVFRRLENCLEQSKIEEGNRWISECILSGYFKELINSILYFTLERVQTSNCTLVKYILTRCEELVILMSKYNTKLNMRNDMRARVLFSEMYTCLCMSKKLVASKPVKVKDKDFEMSEIMNNLFAKERPYFSQILTDNDKVTPKFAFNEFCYMLHQRNYFYCCYWIHWIMLYQNKILSKKKDRLLFERNKDVLAEKYQNKVDIVIWECIKAISRLVPDQNRKQLLLQIYSLYYVGYGTMTKKTRLSVLCFCCRLFCDTLCNYKAPVIIDTKVLQVLPNKMNDIYGTKIEIMKNHPKYWNETYLQLKKEKDAKAEERKRKKLEKKQQEELWKENQSIRNQVMTFYDV